MTAIATPRPPPPRGLYKAKQFELSSSSLSLFLLCLIQFARSPCYTSSPSARAHASFSPSLFPSSSTNSAVTVKFSAVAPSSSSFLSPSQSLYSSPQQRAVRDVNHGISFSYIRRSCPPLCHLGKCVSLSPESVSQSHVLYVWRVHLCARRISSVRLHK